MLTLRLLVPIGSELAGQETNVNLLRVYSNSSPTQTTGCTKEMNLLDVEQEGKLEEALANLLEEIDQGRLVPSRFVRQDAVDAFRPGFELLKQRWHITQKHGVNLPKKSHYLFVLGWEKEDSDF